MRRADIVAPRFGLEPPSEVSQLYSSRGWWDGRSLVDVLLTGSRKYSGLVVRVHSDSRPYVGTVGQVADAAHRLAQSLRGLGLQPGDSVALQLPNWVEAPISFWGLVFGGFTIVPIPHFYGPHELKFILGQTGAKALITADQFGKRDYLTELAAVRSDLPALEHVILVGRSALPGWALSFESLVTGQPLDRLASPDPASVAVLGYTSGTSAQPKGVLLTHRSLAFETCVHMTQAIEKGAPVLQGSPVTHVTGMLVSLLVPLVFGQSIHLLDVWNPDRVLPAMIEYGLAAGNGAPIFLTSVFDHREFSPRHAAQINSTTLGGSPVPPAIIERAESLGIMVWRVYGCTEHPTISAGRRQDSLAIRSLTDGRALPGVELRIVDETGHPLRAGEPGQIQSRGPDLCAGYVDPLLNSSFDEQGWFSTGDVGVLDENGYLTITGRIKDIIIRGGENISATEVEAMLMRIRGIAEAAVVAMPDPRYGERACAFVRVQSEGPVPCLESMREFLHSFGLAKIKWPEELIVVEEFPRTASGKIKKYVLREQLRQRVSASAG
jgi:acyl-CoA synthetase